MEQAIDIEHTYGICTKFLNLVSYIPVIIRDVPATTVHCTKHHFVPSEATGRLPQLRTAVLQDGSKAEL